MERGAKRNFDLELKEVSDAGHFAGMAAVYAKRDEVGDIIEPGAFTKTLRERKGKFPLHFQHDLNNPIGTAKVTDGEEGLELKGELNLEVTRAREIHALMRQFLTKEMPFGLSIGYDTVTAEWKGNTRHLREIRLWEVSATLMPAQPRALITAVKTREGKPFGDYEDFDACVAANQDKDDPEAYCAGIQGQIEGAAQHFASMDECIAANQDKDDPETFCRQMMAEVEGQGSLKSRVGRMLRRRLRVSRAEVARICPPCGEKMRRLGMTALVLSPQTAKQMPPELLAGLCDTYGGDEGFFTRCTADPPAEATDPESFCAWLHEQCTGTWPGEGASLTRMAPELTPAAAIALYGTLRQIQAEARSLLTARK